MHRQTFPFVHAAVQAASFPMVPCVLASGGINLAAERIAASSGCGEAAVSK